MFRDNEFTLGAIWPLFFEILAKEKTKKEDSVDVHLSALITQENIPQQFFSRRCCSAFVPHLYRSYRGKTTCFLLLITFVTNNYTVEPCCFVGLDFLELYALNDSL